MDHKDSMWSAPVCGDVLSFVQGHTPNWADLPELKHWCKSANMKEKKRKEKNKNKNKKHWLRG